MTTKLPPIDDFEGNFYSNDGKTHERVKVTSTGASAVALVPECNKRLATPAFIHRAYSALDHGALIHFDAGGVAVRVDLPAMR